MLSKQYMTEMLQEHKSFENTNHCLPNCMRDLTESHPWSKNDHCGIGLLSSFASDNAAAQPFLCG